MDESTDKVIGGYEVFFTRRRYGSRDYGYKFFTWAHVLLDGQWRAVSDDPYPGTTFPAKVLIAAIEHTMAQIAEGTYR